MNLYHLRHSWRKVTPEVSIVVPTFNEADNILMLTGRIRMALAGRPAEVIFVDDSKDLRTAQVVVAARTLFRTPNFHVRFFHRTGDKRWGGLSGSVIDGIERARANNVIVMDGDLQHPPEKLPELITASEQQDVVIASRYCDGGKAGGLNGKLRHLVSRGSTVLAKAFFPHRLRNVTDPMTGFFLVKKDALDMSLLRPKGFKILLEILARHPHLRVSEIPFEFAERLAGESKSSLTQGLHYFSQLFKIKHANQIDAFARLPRLVRFGTVGAGVFALGMTALYGMVEYAGVPLLAANAIQLALTFWLNFSLNKALTWRERSLNPRAASRFLVSRAATTVLNFYLFAWLVGLSGVVTVAGMTLNLGMHYIAANVISLVAITLVNFLISDRWAFAEAKPYRRTVKFLPTVATVALIGTALGYAALQSGALALALLFVLISVFMFIQASVEVWRMIYGYRNPEAVDNMRFPTPLAQAGEKFCLIVPARHEAEVLSTTLLTLAKQTHPDVTIINVVCDDDPDTLAVAYAAAEKSDRIEVLQYPLPEGVKPSKPLQLNYTLEQIYGRGFTVVGIIDAEDTVHPELLSHVDAAFADKKIQVVQGGVQLMDFDSSWYGLHNVLEYWRWFSSSMEFQANGRFMPLGGNTIFVRYKLLKRAGGWPLSLTEDCALGVRLSSRFRARTAVYYEPRLATREETPESLSAFFRQRVRWFQGFFAEWRKGTWRRLPTVRQRLLAMYVLGGPMVLGFGLLMALIAVLAMAQLKAPVALTMLTYLPIIPLMLAMLLSAVFLYDFGKAYGKKVKIRHYAKLFATFGAYLVLLNAAALWSIFRELRGNNSWDKTAHSGRHRDAGGQTPAMAGAGMSMKEVV